MRWGIVPILTYTLLCILGCAAPPVAGGAAAAPVPNIFDFLGVEAVATKLTPVVDHKIAHLATIFPFLAPKPLLTTLGAPGNAESPSPAISAAAGVVAAEGMAEQKIAALKALAKIGCGGYPEVEEAFLASLGDPTEAVRYEAVQAIRYTAGDPCEPCGGSSCCTEEILKQLDKMANKQDKNFCPFEPSDRVRRAARLALNTCGPPPPTEQPPSVPEEGPPAELLPPPIPAAVDEGLVTASAEIVADNGRPVPPNILPIGTLESMGDERRIISATAMTTRAVRWELISVEISDFESYDRAFALLMALRRRALGQSADLPAEVDPKIKFETTVFDWTRSDDAGASEITDALTRLDVGQISPVLEAGKKLHLVRVLERRLGNADLDIE